jgi:exonuclease SbcD
MRILHTADVHLCELDDERWAAMEAITQICESEKADLLVVAGDLFDTNAAAEELRPALRTLLGGRPFKTVVIPGNHDVDSYESGYFFGEGVKFLNSDNPALNFCDFDEARVIGLPFRDQEVVDMARLLRHVQPLLESRGNHILVYHGEILDAVFSREGFGSEGARRYMPSRLSHFQDVGVDYVLAGHLHSEFKVWELDPKGFVVYPGSPVSITRKETGRRAVNLFDVGDPPSPHWLDTAHYVDVVVRLDPVADSDPSARVADELEGIPDNATIMLTLDGYVAKDEAELVREVEQLLEPRLHDDVIYQFRDVSRIMNHPLFDLLKSSMAEADIPEDRRRELEELFTRAMAEAEL